ncbi:hypothetical protein [Prescottella equi]|uniref:Uncharacterized protein n=1 Tax=Rhodococcus phage REQ2 TaxID=1109713 RepID=G9FH16_9CAUD|nr:hypothetical protein [Prescottella equi]YP_005087117.1 hypothetical protein RoPhREQ2_gp73 [Rhodococcus phage REQ2]AEV51927.1 hypothetical protein [Rhodococcus phage REQ2]
MSTTDSLLTVLILAAIGNSFIAALVLLNIRGVRVRLAIARSDAEEINLHLQRQQQHLAAQEHLLRTALKEQP